MSNSFDALREDTPSVSSDDISMQDESPDADQSEHPAQGEGVQPQHAESHKRPLSPSPDKQEGGSQKRQQREHAGFSQTRGPDPLSRTSSPAAAPPPRKARSYADATRAPRDLGSSPDPYVTQAPSLKPRGTQMPTPPDGFPHPDGVSRAGLLRPVSDRLSAAWCKLKSRTVAAWYVRPYGTPIETAQAHVQRWAHKTLPEGTKAVVALSESKPGERAVLIIMTRLTEQEEDLVLSRPVWLTEDATFFVRAWSEELDNFSHTKTGLTYPPTDASAAELHDLYVPLVVADPDIRNFVAQHNDAVPAAFCDSLDDAMLWLTSGLYFCHLSMVKPGSPDVPRVDWNIYCHSPTDDLEYNLEFRALLAKIDIETDLFGVGRHLSVSWSCSTCMSVSHPTGLCPFPRMKGWKGPAATPLPASVTPLSTSAPAYISVAGSSTHRATSPVQSKGKGKGKAKSRR